MQISTINQNLFLTQKSAKANKQNSLSDNQTVNQHNEIDYPKNYRPYFGARLNRTPENFYEQNFNMQNMPTTMKEYLLQNFEINKTKRPMQLQQEAFAYLDLCLNIDDVMEVFPNEPLFQNLKTLETIRPKHGILCDLRILDAKNNTVLKSEEDLTVYLLKKIYLEGKDLAEINEDFKKDVKEDYLDEEHYKNGYFQYSTLKALGVNFPDISYWKSFQANRLDKEYIPTTRTIDPTKERKPRECTTEVNTPKTHTTRVLTPEEKQQRKEKFFDWWLGLTTEQRLEHIAKIQAAKSTENSVFFKYESEIMTIAAEKIKLSNKMIEFFRKDEDVEYPVDLSNLSPKQSAKMKKFWKENYYLKKQFSQAIIEQINLFESAEALNDDESISLLKNFANSIKANNITRAKLRELASEKGIKKALTKTVSQQCACYPDKYTKDYINYIFNHSEFKKTIMPLYAQLVYQPDNENLLKKTQAHINDLHEKYILSHKRDTLAANIAVASTFMNLQGDSLNCDILTASTNTINSEIANSIYAEQMLIQKPEIDRKMQLYTSGLTDDKLNDISVSFMKMMYITNKNSGYSLLNNDIVRQRSSKLGKVLKKLDNDKDFRKNLKDFLRDYEAYFKYAEDPSTTAIVKTYLMESIIDDYLISLGY